MPGLTDTQPTDNPQGGTPRTATWKNLATWRRGALMALFVVAFPLAQWLLALIAVVQFAAMLITGAPNAMLQSFGRSLAIWLAQVCAFLSAATEDLPFPFSPWPSER